MTSTNRDVAQDIGLINHDIGFNIACMQHFLFCYTRWEGVWVQVVNTAGIRGAPHPFAPSANLVHMFCSAGDMLHTQFLDTLSRILPHLDLIDYWLV